MLHTRDLDCPTALRRVCGFVLSLAIVISLLLPAMPVTAAPGALAVLDMDCAAASASETHCASVCQPALRISADELTPSYVGGGFLADGRKQVAAASQETAPSIPFLGRSGQRTYLRYHRLLL